MRDVAVMCPDQFLKHECDSGFRLSSEMGVIGRCGRTVVISDGGLSSIAVCSLHGCYGSSFHVVVLLVTGFTGGLLLVWCCVSGPFLRSVMEGEQPPQLRRYPSVLDIGKTIAVEYEEEAGFFHQRLIVRTSAIAAMFNATGRMCESPNGLFWILTPDGDVYPEILPVLPTTGLVWLDGRNEATLTTMMPAGRRLERVYRFGVHRRISLSPEVIVRAALGAQETEDTCKEGETPGLPEASSPPATPDTPPVKTWPTLFWMRAF